MTSTIPVLTKGGFQDDKNGQNHHQLIFSRGERFTCDELIFMIS